MTGGLLSRIPAETEEAKALRESGFLSAPPRRYPNWMVALATAFVTVIVTAGVILLAPVSTIHITVSNTEASGGPLLNVQIALHGVLGRVHLIEPGQTLSFTKHVSQGTYLVECVYTLADGSRPGEGYESHSVSVFSFETVDTSFNVYVEA